MDLWRWCGKKLTGGDKAIFINRTMDEVWYARVWDDNVLTRCSGPRIFEGTGEEIEQWLSENKFELAG